MKHWNASERATRLQFGLRGLLVFVAGVAVLLAVNSLSRGLLWRLLAPDGFAQYLALVAVAAAFVLSVGWHDQNAACGTLAVAWQLAMIAAVWKVNSGFIIMNNAPPIPSYLIGVHRSVLHAIALMAIVSALPVASILQRACSGLTRATKWNVLVTFAVVFDVALLALGIVAVLGYRVLRDGPDWSLGLG